MEYNSYRLINMWKDVLHGCTGHFIPATVDYSKRLNMMVCTVGGWYNKQQYQDENVANNFKCGIFVL